MSKEWKSIAAALAPDIPAEAVERHVAALNALEAAFRPLVDKLEFSTEPSFVLMVGREREQA